MAETARLEARVPSDLHEAAKRAAQLEGRSMTDFVIDAVRGAVERSAQQQGMIRLSAEDQSRFISALIDPPQPNQALLAAAKRHREQLDD